MNRLAEPALKAVVDGTVKLHPGDRWYKTYVHWMENIHDWCISRQLWWGHRIPIYYCNDTGRMVAKQSREEAMEALGTDNIRQDEDVMDTWFSSWLWPFATLGWPEKTEDLAYFYPTQTLVTAPEILFFWVARMIISGYEFMGEAPFKDVYLHGTVRDNQGRKMSKSLGNGIDPLQIIHTYSADALRSTLMMLSSEGQDINLAESDFEIGRNFSNKIWNSYRFLGMNLDEISDDYQSCSDDFELADRWILSRLDHTIKAVTGSLEAFHMSDAFKAIYHFFWDEFCDWYLELIKARLYDDENPQGRKTAQTVATFVLKQCMHMLHPVIPFITEEIWQRLKNDGEADLVKAAWPESIDRIDEAAESEMAFVQDVITGIRTARGEMNIPPAARANLLYRTADNNIVRMLDAHGNYIESLARIDSIVAITDTSDLQSAAAVIVNGAELFIPLAGLIDIELEKKRLDKEIGRLEKQVTGLEKKLSNDSFLAKAPAEVVAKDKQKLHDFAEKLGKLKQNLERL